MTGNETEFQREDKQLTQVNPKQGVSEDRGLKALRPHVQRAPDLTVGAQTLPRGGTTTSDQISHYKRI